MSDASKDKRTKRIALRVSENEFSALEKKAKKLGVSVSDYIRRSLDNVKESERETPRVRKKRVAPERDVNPDLLYAIHRIGSNMNQIAKALNVANLHDDEVSAKELLLLLFSIEAQLEKVIKQNDQASDELVQKLKNELLTLVPPKQNKGGEIER